MELRMNLFLRPTNVSNRFRYRTAVFEKGYGFVRNLWESVTAE